MDRFARALVRWRWVVLVVWAVIGAVAAVRAPATPSLLNIRGGSARETEASRTEDLLTRRFSRPIGEFFAVTLESPASFDQPAPRATLDTLLAALGREPYIRGLVSFPSTGDTTFLSRDHRATFVIVALEATRGDSAGALVLPVRALVKETLARVPDGNKYRARVTGRAPLDLDVRTVVTRDSAEGEKRLLPLTLVILVLAFGALVAAALPLIVGVLAITVSLAIIGVIAHYTPMSVFVLNMTTMIGLGVGIDYSLLVVTRFREELARGTRRRVAAANTLATAGRAVITSGLTVVVGFGALLLTPLIETRSVGIGGLIVVAVAVLLSITLLPALLAVLGREIDRPRWLARRLTWYHAPQVWEKWARTLSRHPIRALGYGGAVIALLTLPVFFIKIGLPSRHWWPTGTEAGEGLDALSAMGVAGFVQPVRVLVQLPEGRSAVEAASLRGLMTLADSLKADPRVREVRSVVNVEPKGSLLGYSVLYSDLPAARAKYPDFLDAYLSSDERLALMDVILADTTSLTTATDVVIRARQLAKAQLRGTKGMTITVGGYSAAALDFQEDLLERFPLLVILILGATAVMLAIAFKSVLVPIKAIIMNTLSVSATFGLIVLVFQHGVGSQIFGLDGPTSAIFVAVPVLVFAVVFGLSMDYEVFLLSRIKEAFDRSGRNTEATMEGLSATASVITSAALIMILVFGIFAFARVLAMQLMGFGLAVAVLLDATVIRMVLVPAFMQAMGRWNWWPGVKRIRPKGRPSVEMPELRP
ncbi:MAG TPA: MMPL family transporter [Gemmatimonadales bacterium]|jgi:RND superfamily putative drug exporter|nr:MMPL family transporter [Gemmatimonadales bacterium]